MNTPRLIAAFTSFLTVLAALPYELGEAAMLIPPKWKATVAITAALATVILRAFNATKPIDPKK